VLTVLEHPEAPALLKDAVLSAEQLQELGERLEPFLARYLPLSQRSERGGASVRAGGGVL
jgi:hypothetical protein